MPLPFKAANALQQVTGLKRFSRIKRVVDLAIAVASSPVTLPLGLVVSLIVRRKLGTPVLFRQERTGLHERSFQLLKFRTMTHTRDAHGNLLPDRHRLTRTGRCLRLLSLDELPQLVNVARGDMSVVGPRPLYPHYLPHYTDRERKRHLVRPGITGLAQTSGRNSLSWDQRLERDAEYVERASLRGDIRIIAKTVAQVVRRSGVTVIASDSGEPLHIERSYPTDGVYRLRRLRESDLEWRTDAANHLSVRRYMKWPDDITLESTRAWLRQVRQDPRRVDFTAVERRGGYIVAMAGLKQTDAPRGAKYYVFVDPARHGTGIGSAVTRLVLAWACSATDYSHILLTVDCDNVAAVRIYLSLGFRIREESAGRLTMTLHCEGK